MALNYLTIPGTWRASSHLFNLLTALFFVATSVDVERIFSRGRLILPHVRNGLSGQSIRALLCLGEWSLLGLIKDDDVFAGLRGYPMIEGEGDIELESGGT